MSALTNLQDRDLVSQASCIKCVFRTDLGEKVDPMQDNKRAKNEADHNFLLHI